MTTTKTKIITKGKKQFNGRVYREPDGVYLSVTSIINPEGIAYPPELLVQYSTRGTIVHKLFEHFVKHHQLVTPESICDADEVLLVREGSLKLSIEACNFFDFFQEHGHKIVIAKSEQKLKNTVHKFAGRADIIGMYEKELTVMDVKTSGNYDAKKLVGYWKQQAAYANCITPRPKKMVILPINPTSPRGYDDPIVETDIDGYFNLFLQDLQYVRENYIMPLG